LIRPGGEPRTIVMKLQHLLADLRVLSLISLAVFAVGCAENRTREVGIRDASVPSDSAVEDASRADARPADAMPADAAATGPVRAIAVGPTHSCALTDRHLDQHPTALAYQ
jgi:hypothetical protein